MKKHMNWLYLLVAFIILFLLSLSSYLLFHTISELFTIIVAGVVFIITLNSRKYFVNQYLIVIGISYLFIATLDLFHTLTYTGMPIFTNLNYPANQLWIAARFYESIILFISFTFLYGKRINIKRVYIFNILATIAILVSILWLEIFPDCFIDGVGLTPFKKISEYIISSIMVVTLYVIYKRKNDFSKRQFIYLNLALISTIISELLFTFYISNYDISNLFGHYFKVLSFIFIYQIIIKEALQDPYNLIFKELEESRKALKIASDQDPLTGLKNRRSLEAELEKLWLQSKRDNKPVSVLVLDIDDFKFFNDKYGHSKGDEILIDIAAAIQRVVYRPLDIVSRYGGEEFLIVLYDCTPDMINTKAEEIHQSISKCNHSLDEQADLPLTASIGYVTVKSVEGKSFEDIINLADKEMYKAKANGKNCTIGVTVK